MKKLFISQPMRGKSDEEILKEREAAICKAKEILNDDVEVLETFFDDFNEDAKPLNYLARSIEFLAKADVAFFVNGWQNYRGCRIEHTCAVEYNIDIILVDSGEGPTINELEFCFNNAIKTNSKYIAVLVKTPNSDKPEMIINVNENFNSKLDYYKNAYNKDLTLKTCDGINIVGFTYGSSFSEIEALLRYAI